jgi:hypothetical protein
MITEVSDQVISLTFLNVLISVKWDFEGFLSGLDYVANFPWDLVLRFLFGQRKKYTAVFVNWPYI